ncbi:MAG: hypothetical protein N2383_12100, partial [Caldilineales bacterium]|nr:hypothetical protein [Caldilineales bacterium]
MMSKKGFLLLTTAVFLVVLAAFAVAADEPVTPMPDNATPVPVQSDAADDAPSGLAQPDAADYAPP